MTMRRATSAADRRDQRGATAVEYALVLGLVSLVIVGTTVILGARFTTWASALADTLGTLLG